jgi:hypothetical protein
MYRYSAMNKTMPAQPSRTPGAAMIGDAFNMRHPLTAGAGTTCQIQLTHNFKAPQPKTWFHPLHLKLRVRVRLER